ncbi:MAG: hypothetical protein A2W00_02175 [Candidatus Eisenbacteria bacterium RBG_16_71_46]|nr:MAG: hypothetical protein A2W00_02175 [Candidatus Eisenbacteria bacterium RBG_16_71_46]OGF20998.1 MAG: hypothetical protein A2V63_02290 [Candidatus Eisenbacteria bacterium RBG_19FT_COMBO_70_11]
MDSRWTLVAALVVLSLAPVAPLLAGPGPAPALPGFRAADADSERAREALVAAALRPDTLRQHLRILTERPHVAGTPEDRATAEYVRDRLSSYGFETRIEAIPVYLDYPTESRLELIEPDREPLAVRERGVAWDKDAYDGTVFDAFHGYGASGDVTAQAIYANYGDVDDLRKLAEMGIDVRGHILLVRYGKIFRGLKVRNAEQAGAAAVVIFSDPADDGFARDDPYPRGPARPSDAIQRGSVQFLSEGPGDPSTPGWASRAGGRRLKPAEMKGIPRTPSLPIAWAEAEKILEALDGPVVPAGWQGGVPLTYHVGPGPAKLHLVTRHDYAVRPIWNVIATLRGRERPDEWVVCGNHRDAWTYGAVDPNSGTICMLELARGVGRLARAGWRPRRTLVLCSWDGEEYGLLGSTEWCEANAEELQRKVVAYLNVDVAVSGKDIAASGVHALRDLVASAMADVRDPRTRGSLYQSWADAAWKAGKSEWTRDNRERRLRGEPEAPFAADLGTLGSGSDYTAFVDHLGIPALDMRFGGLNGIYHSIYDDFAYMDRVVDPGYDYHVALTDLWTRVALRLAEAEVLPLRYTNAARFVLDQLQAVADRVEDMNATLEAGRPRFEVDLAPAREAASRMLRAAQALERATAEGLDANAWPPARLAAVNASLRDAERALLGAGLPGRPWFRHEIYAPGLNTGYAAVPLPRLGQALLDQDPAALAAGAAPLREALERAATALEHAAAP